MADYDKLWQIMADYGRFWQILSREKGKVSASPRLWEPFVPALSEFWAIVHNMAH